MGSVQPSGTRTSLSLHHQHTRPLKLLTGFKCSLLFFRRLSEFSAQLVRA